MIDVRRRCNYLLTASNERAGRQLRGRAEEDKLLTMRD